MTRYYSSIAGEMTLTTGIDSSQTSMVLTSVSGLPLQTPFTLVVDPGTIAEEIVTATLVSGNTLTILRGEDMSAAQSHTAGAAVRHMATARDFREPQEHLSAVDGVHGIGTGSSAVGTQTVQTLTNKSIPGAYNSFSDIPQVAVTGLVNALSSEASTRAGAVSTLTSNGAAEVTARVLGDNTEVTNRQAGDTTNATAIASLATSVASWVNRTVTIPATAAVSPTNAQGINGDIWLEWRV